MSSGNSIQTEKRLNGSPACVCGYNCWCFLFQSCVIHSSHAQHTSGRLFTDVNESFMMNCVKRGRQRFHIQGVLHPSSGLIFLNDIGLEAGTFQCRSNGAYVGRRIVRRRNSQTVYFIWKLKFYTGINEGVKLSISFNKTKYIYIYILTWTTKLKWKSKNFFAAISSAPTTLNTILWSILQLFNNNGGKK